jgi:serine/threonine protein kinase
VDLRGPWAGHGRSDRRQGWKLHLSSTPVQAPELLSRVLPLFRDWGSSFKAAKDETTLFFLNEGRLGPTQIGKFMTLYPPDDDAARAQALALIERTDGLDGPAVPTDLHLGGVVYARYGGFNPDVRRDRFGQISLEIEDADGTSRADSYLVPYRPPENRSNPFADLTRPVPLAPPVDGVRLFGPGYRFLQVLKPDPKGSVYLAFDLRSQAQASLKVIKEGRRHCLSDRQGRDIRIRLQRQGERHRALVGKAPVPSADDYFEVAGNGYLPLEYVEGSDLGTLAGSCFGDRPAPEQNRIRTALLRTVQAVTALHRAGVVHRDLTHSNVRVRPDGTVTLLDLELAWRLGEADPPFSQGTPGFMSPQQERREEPAFADDLFALGALGILLLAGLDPRRVLFGAARVNGHRLAALSGAPLPLARVVAACVAQDPRRRPSLDVLAEALSTPPPGTRPRVASDVRDRTGRALAPAARGLVHDVLQDASTGLWLSPVIQNNTPHEQTVSSYGLHRSTSRGVAGVVFVLARLARFGIVEDGTRERVNRAVDWLLSHAKTPDDQLSGLHFGEAGVALSIAEAVASGLIETGAWLPDYLDEALRGPLDWPDVTHGMAGQGLAALECASRLRLPALSAHAARYAAELVRSQDPDGGWTLPAGVQGLEGVRYTGFAHGVAGIAYFLSTYGAIAGDRATLDAAARGADWLWERAVPAPAGGPALHWRMREEEGEERWHWWCHGGPGIALTFLKLYELHGRERDAEAARRALRAHPENVRHSNLSQCHCLAGLGECYLEAVRVLGEREWQDRADAVAATLLNLSREGSAGGLTWLVEDVWKPTGDLMVGCGGVTHFLLRHRIGPGRLGAPLLPDVAGRQS